MKVARRIFEKMELELNEEKTKIVRLPGGQFDFLGYTFAEFASIKSGKRFIGTRPSKKSLKSIQWKIHNETSRKWTPTTVESRVKELNRLLRGWCNYFNQGPVFREYEILRQYTGRRLRRWLMMKHKRRGTGYRQYSDKYLYEKLGLYRPDTRITQPVASKGTTS